MPHRLFFALGLSLFAPLAACGSAAPASPTEAAPGEPADEVVDAAAAPAASSGGCASGSSDQPVQVGARYAARCTAPDGAANTYVVTTPSDVAGGLLEIGLIDVKGDPLELEIQELGANAKIVRGYRTDEDAAVGIYTTVAPATRYRITVRTYSSFRDRAATYDLTLAYTKIEDPHEPNDTLAKATPIAAETDVKGVVAIGLADLPNQSTDQLEDWFSVELAAGTATFTLTTPDSPLEPLYLRVFDADGKLLRRKNAQDKETRLEIVESLPKAGAYKVCVTYYGASLTDLRGDQAKAPPSLLQPYTLRVTR